MDLTVKLKLFFASLFLEGPNPVMRTNVTSTFHVAPYRASLAEIIHAT